MTQKTILDLMKEAAQKSAVVIRENFYTDNDSDEKKSHKDIVTKTDKLSQKIINEHLSLGMKELGFNESEIGFIEEESSDDVVKKHTFIVDPIDGTSNFSASIPHVCISIGYAKDKEMNMGVVLNPLSGDLYFGEKGKGSFLENEVLGQEKLMIEPKPMSSWMVASHFNRLDVLDQQLATYRKLYPVVRGLRNLGSLTLDICFVAQGPMSVVFNNGAYFWDLAAARVILEEAGGKIYDGDGNELEFNWEETKKGYETVTCHPDDKEKIFEFLK
jgi:myo-inositol-1(or 4)-monophosphatase